MGEWLHLVTRDAVIVIDTMALIVVVAGTVEAFFTGLWAAFLAPATHRRVREVWLRYGRWLVAGLTFQLAANIIGTSIAPKLAGGRSARCDRRDTNLSGLFPRAGLG